MPQLGDSIVTPEVVEAICSRIVEGRTLADVTRDSDLPSRDAVYWAIRSNQAVADAIARARQQSAHALAESVIEIIDEKPDPAMIQWARNRCDQRRWLAGKYNAQYADRPSDINVNVNLSSLIEASYEAPAIEHEGKPNAIRDLSESRDSSGKSGT